MFLFQRLIHSLVYPLKIKTHIHHFVPDYFLQFGFEALIFDKSVLMYPASRGYIFAVWAGVRKVASADNRSIPSRNLNE